MVSVEHQVAEHDQDPDQDQDQARCDQKFLKEDIGSILHDLRELTIRPQSVIPHMYQSFSGFQYD